MRSATVSGCLGLLLVGLAALGCNETGPEATATNGLPTPALSEGPRDELHLEVEGLGEIRIELLPELGPITVTAIVERVEEGRYDGTTFHRVIPDFMIQGGNPQSRDNDPRDDHHSGGGLGVPDERSGYPMARGTVAMANAGRAGTTDVQFFIVHGDSPHLDGAHNIVGRVVAGLDVVDAIAGLELDTYGRYGPPNRPYPVDARIARMRHVPAGERVAQGERSRP
ncbi:MAG: peptidylprolyl isomerase [Myxococcota bacterium]